jgi:hypothetical protein
MLIAGARHLHAVLEEYVAHDTGIVGTEPGSCGHQTATTSPRPR